MTTDEPGKAAQVRAVAARAARQGSDLVVVDLRELVAAAPRPPASDTAGGLNICLSR